MAQAASPSRAELAGTYCVPLIRRVVVPFTLAAFKLAVSLFVFATGFRAISDDDYSRVTIAQEFALHPRLDPSGTSWLPLPFWVYGGAMKTFGVGLDVAQGIAVALGVAGAVAVWWVARLAGLSRRAAIIAALLGACIPHAAFYGAAMVPDYPTAVLVLTAAVSLTSVNDRYRLLGACCACAATLSRYETWPVALIVAMYAAYDAIRRAVDRRWLIGTAALAPLGAIAWLAHGIARHHDAFFFLKRVAAYRRALGENALPPSARLLKQPLALFTGEPELVLALLLLLLAAWLLRGNAGLRGRGWLRPSLALLGLVLCLVVGDWLDGAPTHHEDRVFLSVWLGLGLLVGELVDRVAKPSMGEPTGTIARVFARWPALRSANAGRAWHTWARYAALGLVISGAVVTTTTIRPLVVKDEPFADRSGEVAIGLAAAKAVPAGEHLAVYTNDYGYFAVQAAFARPFESAPLAHHDPRRRDIDALSSPVELSKQLDAMGAHYLVLPAPHRPKAAGLEQVPTTASNFDLFRR